MSQTFFSLTGSAAGAVSTPIDISAISSDWTISLRVDALTVNTLACVVVQESLDNFVSDIRALAVLDFGSGSTYTQISLPDLRAYQHPSARFGVSGAKMRLTLQSIIGASPSVTVNGCLTA